MYSQCRHVKGCFNRVSEAAFGTQGRGGTDPIEGSRSVAGDFRDLFGLRAHNTILIKASYWLNW